MDPIDKIDLKEKLKILNNEEKRILIMLSHGYSLKEIADMLERNHSTIKSRASRIKKKIYKKYGEDG
jgi:DNA-binding NarL/FixJ family response regulator